MVLKRFTIFLDSPDATYLPGQEVTGNIHIWNDLPKNVKGVYIECQGFARVNFIKEEPKWRTVRRRGRRSYRELNYESVLHQAKEDYFYQRVNLRHEGDERWRMDGGRHQYPFSFVLPTAIPSSFEGAHGHVRYTIRAVFQRPRKFNYESKIPFTVNSPLDLNTFPELTDSATVSNFKTLGFWCCKSNPITARMWLERTGYVPGERIYLNADVENLSRRTMDSSKIQLVELTNFHATDMTEQHVRVIHEQHRGQFNAAEFWENYPISVPPVAPSELRFCSIIDVSYEVRFIVNPGPLSFNLELAQRLIIGNVPLRGSFTSFQQNRDQLTASAEMSLQVDTNPFLSNASETLSISNDYPDLPPPTYEECMFGGNIRDPEDSDHVVYGVGESFKPRYATYR